MIISFRSTGLTFGLYKLHLATLNLGCHKPLELLVLVKNLKVFVFVSHESAHFFFIMYIVH